MAVIKHIIILLLLCILLYRIREVLDFSACVELTACRLTAVLNKQGQPVGMCAYVLISQLTTVCLRKVIRECCIIEVLLHVLFTNITHTV